MENSRLWAVASKAFDAGLMTPAEGTDVDVDAAVHREIWELYSLRSVKGLSKAQYRAYTNDLQMRLDGGTAGVARQGYLADAHDVQLFVVQRADEVVRASYKAHRSWLVAQGTNWDTVVELLDSFRLYRKVHKRLTEKQGETIFQKLTACDMSDVMVCAEIWREKYCGSKPESYFFGIVRQHSFERKSKAEEEKEKGNRGVGVRGCGGVGEKGEDLSEGDPERAKAAIKATSAAKRVRRELGLPEEVLTEGCACQRGMMHRLGESGVTLVPCPFCQDGLQAMVRAAVDKRLPAVEWYREHVELAGFGGTS